MRWGWIELPDFPNLKFSLYDEGWRIDGEIPEEDSEIAPMQLRMVEISATLMDTSPSLGFPQWRGIVQAAKILDGKAHLNRDIEQPPGIIY